MVGDTGKLGYLVYFMELGANQQMYHLMVSDYCRPWALATPEMSQVWGG